MNKAPTNPAKPDTPIRKENGFKYRLQYGVIVICDDEQHHRRVFDELKAAGHTCRIVCV